MNKFISIFCLAASLVGAYFCIQYKIMGEEFAFKFVTGLSLLWGVLSVAAWNSK